MRKFLSACLLLSLLLTGCAPSREDLFQAINSRDGDRVRKILNCNPDLATVKDAEKRTPLDLAGDRGYFEIAEILREKGAFGPCSHSDFIHAVQEEDTENIKKYIAYGVSINEEDPEEGMAALHIASRDGLYNAAEILVEAGADVNAKAEGYREWSPLHFTALKGHENIAKLLLDSGADIRALLKDKGDMPLHVGSKEGRTDVVKVLVDCGADVNAKGYRGWTPLHRASAQGHGEIAEILIKSGADVNATDMEQWTPLHQASFSGHSHLVEILIESGAHIDAKDKKGRTPLDLAKERGHIKTAGLLGRVKINE